MKIVGKLIYWLMKMEQNGRVKFKFIGGKMKLTGIRISEELKEKVKELAKKEGRSFSKQVEYMLKKQLEEK